MSETLLALFGLKFHPFRPEVPVEALHMTPAVEAFFAAGSSAPWATADS